MSVEVIERVVRAQLQGLLDVLTLEARAKTIATEVMVTCGEEDLHLIKVITKTPVAPRDILILRVAKPMSRFLVDGLRAEVTRCLGAGWSGLLVILCENEDLRTLPDDQARELYATLKKRFDPER